MVLVSYQTLAGKDKAKLFEVQALTIDHSALHPSPQLTCKDGTCDATAILELSLSYTEPKSMD